MAARFLGRRLGPLGLALTAYDVWRRLPERQRRQVVQATRKHGPRLAAKAVQSARTRRPRGPQS